LIQTYRQYPLEEAAEPPETNFVSLTGKDANLLTNEGFAYFETLARYINENPPRSQDMAMLGMLETLGIAHGRPFEPDERMKAILTEAATVGRAMAEALAYAPRVPKEIVYAYPGERRWKKIFFADPTFHEPEYLAIDLRSKYAFEAIGTAKSMVVSVPGQGSQYIGAYQDADGDWLTGDNSYRIQLPKDVPANMFWSLTVYDNDTRSMIRNEHGRPLVGSVHGAVANEDGSRSISTSAPNQPADVPKRTGCRQPRARAGSSTCGCTDRKQPYFDKTWIPGDAEK
jgi:hypothetical protein